MNSLIISFGWGHAWKVSMFFLFKDVQALSELLYAKGYLP